MSRSRAGLITENAMLLSQATINLVKHMAKSSGINELKTLVRTPRANVIYEGFIGSLRQEYLDCILILYGF